MFEDETARDEAYSELDILWYDGDIRDMLPYPQTHHDKAQLTGASLKKLMLDRLPVKVLELMHTVDLTGNSDQEMIEINSPTGRAAEKWEDAIKNLSTRTPRNSEKTWEKPKDKFRVQRNFQQTERKRFKNKKFVNLQYKSQMKTVTMQVEGVPQGELTQQRNPKECMKCAWPGDWNDHIKGWTVLEQ